MNWRKQAALAALGSLLFAAAPMLGQVKSDNTKQDRASVLLRFAKEGAVRSRCSEELGVITQSMLQVDGVKNVKMNAKNNGVDVSYDPAKTTPEKIVAAFNKENPDSLLQSPGAKDAK